MSPAELIRMVAGRPVHIWGAMIVGQGMRRALERHGLPVHGFLDSSPSLRNTRALDLPILAPDSLLAEAAQGRAFIIIASGHHAEAMESLCRAQGLEAGGHYLLASELNDIDPSVDISGTCNLRCVSCPRGNLVDPDPVGFMSLQDYSLVMDKLLAEIPFLGSIQFYAWGEPLLNRQLPEMIELTRAAKVLTAISTNLKISRGLDKVIAAKPDWLKVSASGFGKNYEIGHTGGDWEKFHANLHELARLRDALHPDMQITLNYHLYKHNTGESYNAMQRLCQELGFLFRPNMAYLYSLDNVLDYVEGRPISAESRQTLDMMLLDIEAGLEKCRQRQERPCPEERCLPIAWDRRVRFCGVYFHPYIASDFLQTSVADIMAKRHDSAFCKRCMSHGLHQYTGVYLEEKFLAVDGEGQE